MQDQLGQREIQRQLFQHLFVSGEAAAGGFLYPLGGDAQPAEQDFLQLLGRVEVERLAGQRVGLLLQAQHLATQLMALRRQDVAVDQHAVAFHLEQHFGHRQLDVAVHALQLAAEQRRKVPVQTQGDVGILGGIVGRNVHRHFVEADLLGSLAADVFIADRGFVQMAARQIIHIVAQVAFDHVRRQHGIVGHAAQGDAVIGQHVAVVLQVLPQLFLAGILQPRLEPRHGSVAIQLLRRIRATVRQRQVGGMAGLDGEAQADNARLHRVQAGGFGVQRHDVRCGQRLQPVIQLRIRENSFVMACQRCGSGYRHGWAGHNGLAKQIRGGTEQVTAAGWRCRRHPGGHFGSHFGAGHRLLHFAQEGAEAAGAEQLGQPRQVALAMQQAVQAGRQLGGQIHIALDGDQLASARQPVQRRAQIFAHLAANVGRMRNHAVQAVVLLQPFHRGLGAALVHARHVVHLVADQRQVIDDAVRRYAEFFLHPGFIQRLVGHGVD